MMYQTYPFHPAVAAGALALFLAACVASPTPYQVADGDGGYTDRKLEDGAYQVTFTGNGATPRRSVQEAVLLRAAEVTLDANQGYFKVTGNSVEPVSKPKEGGWFDLSSFFGSEDADEGLVSTLDFVVVEEKPKRESPNIFEASKLVTELKDKVLNSKSAAAAIQNGAIIDDLRAPSSRDY